MGLDITAYKGLEKVENPEVDGDGCPSNGDETRFYSNPDFPGRSEGIEHGAVYKFADSFGFMAGAYSSYNNWREQLAKLAGYPALQSSVGYRLDALRHDEGAWQAGSGPFYELINFSDCEGTIGPVVSAKLAKDFADFQEKADQSGGDDFRMKYSNWRKAFEMAAENGAVDFH